MLLSKLRKEDSQICRKDSNGQFKCPSKEPVSMIMAIPWYPKSQSSLLIEPSGIFLEKNRQKPKNCIQGLGTSIATVDTSNLLNRWQLEWGCSVVFQNELLVFGVHQSSPDWSSVSY